MTPTRENNPVPQAARCLLRELLAANPGASREMLIELASARAIAETLALPYGPHLPQLPLEIQLKTCKRAVFRAGREAEYRRMLYELGILTERDKDAIADSAVALRGELRLDRRLLDAETHADVWRFLKRLAGALWFCGKCGGCERAANFALWLREAERTIIAAGLFLEYRVFLTHGLGIDIDAWLLEVAGARLAEHLRERDLPEEAVQAYVEIAASESVAAVYCLPCEFRDTDGMVFRLVQLRALVTEAGLEDELDVLGNRMRDENRGTTDQQVYRVAGRP